MLENDSAKLNFGAPDGAMAVFAQNLLDLQAKGLINADVLTATKITAKNVSGVTVEGGANGPSYYWKYVEYGTVKQKAPKFINESAAAKEAEVLDAVTAELKSELGL